MSYLNFSDWIQLRKDYNSPRKGIKSEYVESTLGTEDVDASQIESLYANVKKSVMIVRDFDKTRPIENKQNPVHVQLLRRISTSANLASGSAYGVYMSSENKKWIGPDVVNQIKLIYPNDPTLGQKLQKLPKHTILQYIPNIDEKKIVPSDVIHVDVMKHVKKYGDSPAAIIEIASTIVHEATHVIEQEETGRTADGSGTAVERAEAEFKAWAKQNWRNLSVKYGMQGDYPFA